MDAILFYSLSGLALASAVLVVAQRHAIGSALALIVTLSALSGIFGLLGSPFIAVLQLVVYAGAIMVLFVFVLMLLNVQREEQQARSGRRLRLVAVGIAAFFLLQLGSAVARLNMMPSAAPLAASARDVARLLFSAQYLYAFEATSVLILAALVGAIALARKETP